MPPLMRVSPSPSMRVPARAPVILLAIASLLLAALSTRAARAQGCFSSEVAESREIAIDLGGGKTAILRASVSTNDEGGLKCWAWIEIPLSNFPTSRLAMRPADVVRSMHDIVKELGSGECTVTVSYENDVEEDIAEHELCVQQDIAFGRRKLWTRTDERFCWEPDPEVEAMAAAGQ